MGNHKDPDSLAFIESLRLKGEEYGYVSQAETHIEEYFFDILWKLKEKQSPLITFEIETKDGRVIFANTLKIYGTSSSKVPKPWHHFMIIYKGNLTTGHRDSLHNLIEANNLHLYEDIFGKEENLKKLMKNLEDLNNVIDLKEQIKKDAGTKSIGVTLSSVLAGISEVLGDDAAFEKPEVSVKIQSKKSPEKGLRLSMTTETPKGEPTFMEKLTEANKTLKPFTIESPQLKDLKIEGKSIFPEGTANAKLTVTPNTPIHAVKMQVLGEDLTFDNILLRRVKTEGTVDHLSSEERNLPFVYSFQLDKENEKNNFSFEFKNENANVKQMYQFEKLIQALNSHKEFVVVNPQDLKPIFGFRAKGNFNQSEDWLYLLSKLAYIQDKTGHVIPVPKTINQNDIHDIFSLIRILETGQDSELLNEMKMTTTKESWLTLMNIQKKDDKISNLKTSQTVTFKLFEEIFELGKGENIFPDMIFSQPIEEIAQILDKTPQGKSIELALKPILDKHVTMRFEKWS
jgi:hypothetical protein